MQFNPYIWSLYQQSDQGAARIRDFESLRHWVVEKREGEIRALVNRTQLEPLDDDYVAACVSSSAAMYQFFLNEPTPDSESAWNAYRTLAEHGVVMEYEDGTSERFFGGASNRDDVALIFEVSLGLYAAKPEYFIPYLFSVHFFRLSQLCAEFNIGLPPVPKKSDIGDRLKYYGTVCQTLYEFRRRNQMSTADLCAFLYDFATPFLDNFVTSQLPEPTRAYLVGGGINHSGDFEYLDSAPPNALSNWQGNLDTLPGDVIVMYCLSPRSAIHSIWRAISPGFADPFFSFYNTIWISHPMRVPNITFREITDDPILSEIGVVRGNMQGINGYPLTSKEYKQILLILSQKGFAVDALPQIREDELISQLQIDDERGVEISLVEPLLISMGFKTTDWIRQLPVRMGRGYRLFADYGILPQRRQGDTVVRFVWEAKYRIRTDRELSEAYAQARSYALRLSSVGFAVASIEGLWIWPDTSTARIDKPFRTSWTEAQTSDGRAHLLRTVGKAVLVQRKCGT